jgi:hypothetical protein
MARPLAFEPNLGQTAPEVKCLARGPGYELFLTKNELVVAIDSTDPKSPGVQRGARLQTMSRDRFARPRFNREVVRLKLTGTSKSFEPAQQMAERVNYFIGSDPSKWRTNIPTYGRVVERGVWPGIDVAWYGHQNQLETDLIVAPNADPKAIQFAMGDASKLAVDHDGNQRLAGSSCSSR